jgi:hypothetical protein
MPSVVAEQFQIFRSRGRSAHHFLANDTAGAGKSRVQMMALGKRDESCDLRSDNGPLSLLPESFGVGW